MTTFTKVQITSVSPHAEQYPVLSDDEIQVLAADIAENGLFDPITVTSDGVLLDGRNRLRACEIAGVEPRIDVYNGDENQIGAFVRSKNRRRHQPTGSRAMSEALSLQLDGKRKNGKWAYGSLTNDQNSDRSANRAWMVALANAGVVLDHVPALAQEVVDGHLALDAAYRQALEARDAERRKLEQAERIAAEEADARAFIEQSAPDLAAQVGDVFESYAEAQAVWEKRNREEAAQLAREKAEKEAQAKADRENAEDRVRQMLGSLARLQGLEMPEWREFTRDCVGRYPEAAPPTQRHVHDPSWLRSFAGWVTTYADELEQS